MTLDEEERRRAYDALWLRMWRLGRHPEDPAHVNLANDSWDDALWGRMCPPGRDPGNPGYVNLANDPWDDEWGLTIPAPPANEGLAKVLPFDPARKRKPA